ncbi:hypothetical protein QE152_g27647 [Popillia japonica]|uniref:Uncharacterized protein n=1 Tax=Popillia japonica TaxID=7064 RepID=A0AAW1JV12_POPJA
MIHDPDDLGWKKVGFQWMKKTSSELKQLAFVIISFATCLDNVDSWNYINCTGSIAVCEETEAKLIMKPCILSCIHNNRLKYIYAL